MSEKVRNRESALVRRSRYKAAARASGKAPSSPRSRHVEVLELHLQYRYLSAADVGSLLGTSRAHERILTELFHAGLLERRHVHTPATRQMGGSPPAITILTPRGLREWATATSVDLQLPEFASVRKRVASRAKPKDAETEHTQHAWGVSRVQQAIDRGSEKAGLEVVSFIADREAGMPVFSVPVPRVQPNPDAQDRKRRPHVATGAPRKLTLQPDGVFLVRNAKGDEKAYILEFDNARRKHARVIRRALAYWTLVSTEEGRAALERSIGAPGAYLLFVTPNATRRDQLRELTLSTPTVRKDGLFWFVALPDLLEEQRRTIHRRTGETDEKVSYVVGDNLYDTKNPVARKLDGRPSPPCLPSFLTP